MTRVILASASPRRRELLAALIADFEVIPADVPEPLSGDPRENAKQLATAKAVLVARQHPDAVVIGADTIVHEAGRSYGKPEDAADAARILRELRGRPHGVVTGLAVATAVSCHAEHTETIVELAPMSDAAIAAYVASGRPLDKAGAYAIQDGDVPTVAAYTGCYCNVVGLPLWRLRKMLTSCAITCREPHLTLARCANCPDRA
jgi:septum formation protein